MKTPLDIAEKFINLTEEARKHDIKIPAIMVDAEYLAKAYIKARDALFVAKDRIEDLDKTYGSKSYYSLNSINRTLGLRVKRLPEGK